MARIHSETGVLTIISLKLLYMLIKSKHLLLCNVIIKPVLNFPVVFSALNAKTVFFIRIHPFLLLNLLSLDTMQTGKE